MKTKRVNRYILQLVDGTEIGRGYSIQDLANILECDHSTIYKNMNEDGTFKFRKRIYRIIDRLA
jgi:hypothetical protein